LPELGERSNQTQSELGERSNQTLSELERNN